MHGNYLVIHLKGAERKQDEYNRIYYKIEQNKCSNENQSFPGLHFFKCIFILKERESMSGGGTEREEDPESEAGSRL